MFLINIWCLLSFFINLLPSTLSSTETVENLIEVVGGKVSLLPATINPHQPIDHQHLTTEKLNQCYFQPDGLYYQPGSSWHPYLPPFGINKCSLCTCQNSTLKITCRRNFTCPPLACDLDQAIREHPTDCCKKCPDTIQVKSLDGAFGSDEVTSLTDSNLDSTTAGACVLLGRLYPNGHRWHPHVTPFGEIRCVKCICKNGSIKCSRLKCPKGKCGNSPMLKKCCPNCTNNGAEQQSTAE